MGEVEIIGGSGGSGHYEPATISAAPSKTVADAAVTEERLSVPSNMAPMARDRMTPETQALIQNAYESIDVASPQAVMEYGIGAQRGISQFSDSVLADIRSKDTGYVGEALTKLMLSVKDIDADGLGAQGNPLSRLPFVGPLFDRGRTAIARYERVGDQIEDIVIELDRAQATLTRDILMLEGLYERNVEYFNELSVFIAAGEMKLAELNDSILPELRAKAAETGEPMDAQAVADMESVANRFEKKLYDLRLSRTVAIQTAPQIKLIQANNQVLVEKIQSSILNTIPLWKNQMVIAIELERQRRGLELQKQVADTTNDLVKQNSAMLKQGSIEVAKQSERGILDIETLRQANDDLITTIKETIRIQEEGSQRRLAAERELAGMEGRLREELLGLREPERERALAG